MIFYMTVDLQIPLIEMASMPRMYTVAPLYEVLRHYFVRICG